MNNLKILKTGTCVEFGEHNEIKGSITAIIIRFDNYVKYEISYWKNDEFKTIWLDEDDFKTIKPKKTTIGFLDDNKETT